MRDATLSFWQFYLAWRVQCERSAFSLFALEFLVCITVLGLY